MPSRSFTSLSLSKVFSLVSFVSSCGLNILACQINGSMILIADWYILFRPRSMRPSRPQRQTLWTKHTGKQLSICPPIFWYVSSRIAAPFLSLTRLLINALQYIVQNSIPPRFKMPRYGQCQEESTTALLLARVVTIFSSKQKTFTIVICTS